MTASRKYSRALAQAATFIALCALGVSVTAQPPEHALINAGGIRVSVPAGENDYGLQQTSDISKIVDWLAVQPGIDSNRIGIVGISQGGQVALLAAAMNTKVKVVVAYAPLTNVITWHEKTDLSEEMIKEYLNGTCSTPGTKADRSPIIVAECIGANILSLHGEADERVSVNQSIAMHEALMTAGKNSALVTIPNAPHGPSAPEWDELATLERVSSWLDENL